MSFPLIEKIEVNGAGPAPGVRGAHRRCPTRTAKPGDIQWNFEKFLVGPDGAAIARFRPRTGPEDPALVAAIEANLPG